MTSTEPTVGWVPNEHQRAWLDALRGDEFKQGKRAMKRIDFDPETGAETVSYCCLGVACELAGVTWELQLNYFDESTDPHADAYGWTSPAMGPVQGYLPETLRELLNVDPTANTWDTNALVRANDTLGKSFAEIADALEEMWRSGRTMDDILGDRGVHL